MVHIEIVNNNQLYRKMVETERAAYLCQDKLLSSIEKWFSNHDISEDTKIILDHDGSIKIRSVDLIDREIIKDFKMEFNFKYLWFKREEFSDFRNVDEINIITYEYCFVPSDIDKIMGDNQTELRED